MLAKFSKIVLISQNGADGLPFLSFDYWCFTPLNTGVTAKHLACVLCCSILEKSEVMTLDLHNGYNALKERMVELGGTGKPLYPHRGPKPNMLTEPYKGKLDIKCMSMCKNNGSSVYDCSWDSFLNWFPVHKMSFTKPPTGRVFVKSFDKEFTKSLEASKDFLQHVNEI
ncbi:unnamed protein product [Ambrosiozyma monospora]|uniref:Unnamed protein product n=1 Tax=Ambrosiozyma monospora TaxID=43982 RepID=A0ACB5TQ19_AMBMO|nr:unnamed protein product [Ambrosiozyma monospora]